MKFQGKDYKLIEVYKKLALRENKEELFGKESPILQSLVKRNLQSFERGWKTEAEVIDIVKRENPTLTDEDISQYCLGSIEDRVSGVDFKVKGKGYQTKPASKMERLKNGGVRVQTYGMRDWYQRKKDMVRDRKDHNLSTSRGYIIKYKESNPVCIDCKIDYPAYVLDFDHLPIYTKNFALSYAGVKGRTIEAIDNEIKKCEIICSNCHRHRTYLRRNEKRVIKSRT